MSVVPKNISLSIQRSIKVDEYKYNKIELRMGVDIHDEKPEVIINSLHAYIDAQVDRLLTLESAIVKCNKQTIADDILS